MSRTKTYAFDFHTPHLTARPKAQKRPTEEHHIPVGWTILGALAVSIIVWVMIFSLIF